MKNITKFGILLLLTFQVEAKSCEEVRMAFDIGSGSTKSMVAKVDKCKNKILKILSKESSKISYNEALEKNGSGLLEGKILEDGIKAIREMLEKSSALKPSRITAVATSAFRTAKNGKKIAEDFSKKLKFKIKVISQEEEGHLGHLSARSQFVGTEKNLVVWDIGGGSMQMTGYDQKQFVSYMGQLASVTFKNMILDVLQGKDYKQVNSPNPIAEHRGSALRLARAYARIHVPEKMKKLIAESKVLGIGGVHNYSIQSQLSSKSSKYSLAELEELSQKQVLKSDNDLVGEYRSTDVSNLLLVQAFMEELKISEVDVVNASLLEGVLLESVK